MNNKSREAGQQFYPGPETAGKRLQRELLLSEIYATYNAQERTVMDGVYKKIGGHPFGYIDEEPVISRGLRSEREQIVIEAFTVIRDIRMGRERSDFIYDYFAPHGNDLAYRFLLSQEYPGSRVRGTAVMLALLNPETFGPKIV